MPDLESASKLCSVDCKFERISCSNVHQGVLLDRRHHSSFPVMKKFNLNFCGLVHITSTFHVYMYSDCTLFEIPREGVKKSNLKLIIPEKYLIFHRNLYTNTT